MPEQIALFFGEIVIGFEDGEVVLLSTAQEFFAPHTQFFATPAHHCSIIDREGGVGDDEMFIDAHDFAKTFTAWASSHRGVEREEIVGGFFKGDAIGFESGGKMFQILLGIEAQEAFSVAFKKSGFHRVGESRNAVFGTIDSKAVEEEKETALAQGFGAGFDGRDGEDDFVHAEHFTIAVQSRKALLEHHFDLLEEGAVGSRFEGSENGESGARIVLQSSVHNVVCTATSYFFSADGRKGTSDARKEQTEVFVDFGASAHSGTWVAAGHLLFDGNGRWQTFDIVHFGFVHSAQKLSGIGRKALDISALSFGVEGVESQR